jgi:ribosomal protein S18 acetylase RimI-like enzyme
VPQRAKFWRSILAEETGETWVAEENGRTVGFVNFGPCRDEDMNKDEVAEIYAIYLLPEAWGQGVGSALCQQALLSLKESGFREVSLWVLSENEGAIAFYERAGFKADEATKTGQWDDVQLLEVRYRQPL